MECGKIARVQLQRLLHFVEGFRPATLPPVNVASQKRNSRFVRQRTSRGNQLLVGSVVVPIHPVKMLSEGQMYLSGVRAQTADRLNGCFGQSEACLRVVETKEINPVMRSRELKIRGKERRVACNSLLKQLHGLEQIFFCQCAKRNAIDEVFGSQVEIVKLICDFLRNLALDSEHVSQIPIVFLRPNVSAGARINQLSF